MSGGTRFAIEMVNRWSRENDVLVLCSYGAQATFGHVLSGSEEQRVKLRVLDSPAFGNVSEIAGVIARAMRLVLRTPKPGHGIVFAPSDFLWDVLPCVWIKLRNPRACLVSVVWHLIPSPLQRSGASFLRNALSHLSQRLSLLLMAMMSSIVLVPNSIVANQIRSAVGEKTRIELRGGIDYNDIVGLPEEERIFDACFLGRLHPTKGISDLIRVWRQIILEKKDARLAIVGGGPLTTVRRLENDIEQGHLEHNVVFFGETAHEVALRVLKKCKVLIHPSYEEGFSIAICEALACGLPVIAYDLPIYREIYGDLVLLVPTGDVTALAREALGLILNEERRLSLAREGVKQAQEYDWDHVANRISRVMHESLNKCPHARP